MTVASPREIRILGIDPGSRLTGYGCIAVQGPHMKLLGHGTLKVTKRQPGQNAASESKTPVEDRLKNIYLGLNQAFDKFNPTCVVIEKVFFAKNALSALKLGQARGAAILTAAIRGLPVYEYSPNEVKSAVVGHGHADKDQVAALVKLILGRGKALETEFETSDASDAVALALCHAQRMPRR